jgi:GNAT superfamily N-acetyltransferase
MTQTSSFIEEEIKIRQADESDTNALTLLVAERGRLIEAAESVFRNLGCGRVEVTSGAAREAAHRFYVRAGYSEHPKRFIKIL